MRHRRDAHASVRRHGERDPAVPCPRRAVGTQVYRVQLCLDLVRARDVVVQAVGLDSALDDGASSLAASTFAHEYRPALNGFEAVSAGEKSDQEEGHSHLCGSCESSACRSRLARVERPLL